RRLDPRHLGQGDGAVRFVSNAPHPALSPEGKGEGLLRWTQKTNRRPNINNTGVPNARNREGNSMNRTRISRRGFGLLAGAAATTTLFSRRTLAADPIKTAAIYTVPVEQQWVSRIHKAAGAAVDRGDIEYVFSESVSNTDYERVMREYAEAGHK